MQERAASCAALPCSRHRSAASRADAATFRWANDGDANSMDPYTRSETFLLTFTQNIYEPLVRRNRKLKVEPALAQSWEQPSPTIWRFHLRHGVKFQEGKPFTAEDVRVQLSARRPRRAARSTRSSRRSRRCRKIDDFTVDFETKRPEPDPDRGDHQLGASCRRRGARSTTRPSRPTSPRRARTTRRATPTAPGRSSCEIREPDRRTTLVSQPGLVGQAGAQPDRA